MFKLALALGKTVKELVTQIDSAELSEWMAFDAVEPFGPYRDDWRIGNAIAFWANAQIKEGALKPQHFFYHDDDAEQTADDPADVARRFEAHMKSMMESTYNGNSNSPSSGELSGSGYECDG